MMESKKKRRIKDRRKQIRQQQKERERNSEKQRQDMRRSVSVKTRRKRRGSDGNLFHYKMGTDARRLDTARAENNKQTPCFSQRSEESVFRFK